MRYNQPLAPPPRKQKEQFDGSNKMRLVIIESPFAGDVERNVDYAIRCIKDCLKRGEAPFASHILYTIALNDLISEERNLGIQAGFEWGKKADATVVYYDYGISRGMTQGIIDAIKHNRLIEYRSIGKNSLDDAMEV